MFAELVPLLKKQTVTITLASVGDTLIRVNVIPVRKTGDGEKDLALTTPLTMTATPEELDRDFAGQIQQFAASVIETGSSLRQLREVHAAAIKALDAEQRKQLADRKTRGKATPATGSLSAGKAAEGEAGGAETDQDTKEDALPLFGAPPPQAGGPANS